MNSFVYVRSERVSGDPGCAINIKFLVVVYEFYLERIEYSYSNTNTVEFNHKKQKQRKTKTKPKK